MRERNLDAVLLTSIHNINYYSDFLYCSFGRPYALVVTHDNATTVSAGIDGGQPYRRTVGSKEKGTFENIVYTDWDRNSYPKLVCDLLQRTNKNNSKDWFEPLYRGEPSLRIGVENDHITCARKEELEAQNSNIFFVDIAGDTMAQRVIKSEEEIAHIKKGAGIADVGGMASREVITRGVREWEVANHVTRAMIAEIASSSPQMELMDTWTWFQSGINTDGAHNPVTSRRVQQGDILSLNCFPMMGGYYTALERTMSMGEPAPPAMKIWEANCEVHRTGLSLIKPGVSCSEVANKLNEIYHAHGLLHRRCFGYGHSFGVLSHYYGREGMVELREDNHTILKPGMVVSMEPMVTIPEGVDGAGGYREHDILVLHHNGDVENITKFPFGPEHNIL